MVYQISAAAEMSLPVRLHLMKTDGFRKRQVCNVPIFFSTPQYTVKTITTFEEFLQVMQLRHLVFQKEFAGNWWCLRSDRDRYDSFADFLVVKDNKTNAIVGSYRIICSLFSKAFYSSSEFAIDDLLALPETKIELSRACILRSYRNGRVINLLWRGIAQYMEKTRARYLFGCGSVQTMNPLLLRSLSSRLKDSDSISQQFHFPVLKKYKMTDPRPEHSHCINETSMEIPSLIKAYLHAGAKICSEPAIDRKFRCADFLVVLDREEISVNHRQRYVVA